MNLKGQLYINGQWVTGDDKPFNSYNPLNNQVMWQGNTASCDQIAAAVGAAHRASFQWADLSFNERSEYIIKFAQQVEHHRAELIQLIALETGKPLWESATEASSVIGKIKISINAYRERCAEKITTQSDYNACLRYKPHGVVAVLGAFNFPAHLSNGHIVPALLAGNTVVYKPSELTPAVGEFILNCWHASGIPAGVINGIQGAAATGAALLQSNINGVFFTGSYNTGKRIHQLFGERPEVILALEMGGNNPLIIEPVENIAAAVYNTLLSSYITAGQRCTCARRVIIPNTNFGDQFLEQLLKAAKQLTVGAYTDEIEPFMGPVIGLPQVTAYLEAQENLIKLGGQSILAMQQLQENSALLSPGIIDMSTVIDSPDEEIFAPFIQLYRYNDFDEAIHRANNTKFGLSAGLFSDDETSYRYFYQRIKAGLVNWNRPTTGAASDLPFGGVGFSGNHRPSAYFAADYCAYPIANLEQARLTLPADLLPGVHI